VFSARLDQRFRLLVLQVSVVAEMEGRRSRRSRNSFDSLLRTMNLANALLVACLFACMGSGVTAASAGERRPSRLYPGYD
jgi:hypothetical protein